MNLNTSLSELGCCGNVEVDVLGSPSLIIRAISVDVNSTELDTWQTELRSCVKVEVDVSRSPSLIIRAISVDVKQH